jgi:hypothetical protein
VYRVGAEIDVLNSVAHFREFAGTFVETAATPSTRPSVLLRWDIEHPGQFQLMPTPLPGWDGVTTWLRGLPTFAPVAMTKITKAITKTGGQPRQRHQQQRATSEHQRAGQRHRPDGNLPLKVVDLNQPVRARARQHRRWRVIYTPPPTIPAPFTTTFTYNASDAKDAVSNPATVSVAVSASRQRRAGGYQRCSYARSNTATLGTGWHHCEAQAASSATA